MNECISRAVLEGSPPLVALELSSVGFCDSSGLHAFVRSWTRAAALDGQFLLLSPAPGVADYLRITGADQPITVAAALPE